MRKNLGAKPFTYPQPVFIIAAYDENGLPNAMNAAWGGISEMNEISICISEGHKTTANILKRKAFTVSMAEAGQIIACDYVGIVSGNKVPDKFARAGFHATRSEFVDAPLIDELSVAVECKLKDYNPETCILRGEIVNVSVDERVLDQNGKVDVHVVGSGVQQRVAATPLRFPAPSATTASWRTAPCSGPTSASSALRPTSGCTTRIVWSPSSAARRSTPTAT